MTLPGTHPSGPVLVTGGSGKLARRVIELLIERKGLKVITTTRTPDALADLAAHGAEVRYADHDEPATLSDAYRGAQRMLIISSFSIGNRAEQIRDVAAAAKTAGVEHICYTSGAGARPSSDKVTDDHFWSEQAIIASGLAWTMLRHNMYAEHVPLSLSIGVATGRFHSPIGLQGRGYVTRADCARADAGALASDTRECRIIDVTGPAVVTHRELAEIAARLTGRPVAYVPVDSEAAIRAWTDHGVPPFVAKLHAEFDLFASEGHHAIATSAVRDLGGQEPESVEAFLSRSRDMLLPDASARARVSELVRL